MRTSISGPFSQCTETIRPGPVALDISSNSRPVGHMMPSSG
jgi:hypothetical protein